MQTRERTRTIYAFEAKKNIFCIEGLWENDHRDKKSVSTALDFLSAIEQINVIKKQSVGEEAVKQLISDSMQSRYKKYAILYMAFHGEPGSIFIGKHKKKMSLDEIANRIDGRANGKIIHLGCCSTLNVSGWDLRLFLKRTNALAISGFTNDIDFVQSMALELMYFQMCQRFVDIRKIKRDMHAYHGRLIKELGFQIKHL